MPVGKCYINEKWEDSGMATIVVSRNHSNGNFTFGIFLIDLFCLGLKDSLYRFNITSNEFEEVLDSVSQNEELLEVDYALVHNIIYGGIEFAGEYEFKPHKSFQLTQFLLQEDTEAVEIIEIPFGIDGKPGVVVAKENPQKAIVNQLHKVAGEGNYVVLTADDDWQADEYEDDDEEYEEEESIYTLLDDYSEYTEEELREEIADLKDCCIEDVLAQIYELFLRLNGSDRFEELHKEISEEIYEKEVVGDYESPGLDFLPEEQHATFFRLQQLIEEDAQKAIPEVEAALKSFPHPVFANLLYTACKYSRQTEKAGEVLEDCFKKYSNDFMTRVNYGFHLLKQEKYDALKLFMGDFKLSRNTERTTLHILELAGFLDLACLYYAKTGQLLLSAVFQDIYDSYIDIPESVYELKLETFKQLAFMQLDWINAQATK